MSEKTGFLSLPLIAPSQAQKHVTHNEALVALDALVQIAVADRDLAEPPAHPEDGLRLIVAEGASGGFAGKSGSVALYSSGAWSFFAPRQGWLAWVSDEEILCVHDGAGWRPYGDGVASVNPVALVGVNAVADGVNRLSVCSPGVLLSHEGSGNGDMRLSLNREGSGDTASLVLNSGFEARTELGLLEDDRFHIKVSGDGVSWSDRLVVEPATGNIGIGVSAPTQGLEISAQASFSGLWTWDDSHQTCRGTAGNYPSVNFNRHGEVGRSFATGWDPGGRSIFWNRWDPATDGYLGQILTLRHDGHAEFAQAPLPVADDSAALGSATRRWSVIYSATGTINTSDARLKTDIEDCPLGLGFLRALSPCVYRWKQGGADLQWPDGQEPGNAGPAVGARAGRRRHLGFTAQDVKAALDAAGVDCGLWVLQDTDDPDSSQSLRYDQFIAPLVMALQELAERVEKLETP
jgi:hypothetical protein